MLASSHELQLSIREALYPKRQICHDELPTLSVLSQSSGNENWIDILGPFAQCTRAYLAAFYATLEVPQSPLHESNGSIHMMI